MITDRTEQLQRPAAGRPNASPQQRRILRRRRVAGAAAVVQRSAQDMRASVVSAFRALANGVEPRAAQGQAATFYHSSGQAWAGPLGEAGEPVSRARVVAAFRAMAHGVGPDAGREAMARFYRSSGHEWARGLGAA